MYTAQLEQHGRIVASITLNMLTDEDIQYLLSVGCKIVISGISGGAPGISGTNGEISEHIDISGHALPLSIDIE